MKPDPKCTIDRARPCRGCIAASPADCPYPYLLGDSPPTPTLADGPLAGADDAAA